MSLTIGYCKNNNDGSLDFGGNSNNKAFNLDGTLTWRVEKGGGSMLRRHLEELVVDRFLGFLRCFMKSYDCRAFRFWEKMQCGKAIGKTMGYCYALVKNSVTVRTKESSMMFL